MGLTRDGDKGRRMRWLVVTAVVLGTLGTVLVDAAPATAQSTSAPANFYGRGAPVKAGDVVAILVNGKMCGSTTVNGSLEWALAVPQSAPCTPTENAPVSATVNGGAATLIPSAVWKVGGTPPDIANGYAISLPGGTNALPTTPTAPGAGSGVSLSGSIPRGGGYGIIAVTSPGTIEQVAQATGCPTSTMALYSTVNGVFLAYVPGTSIGAVNAAFLAAFPNGNVPVGTALMGKCV